MKEKKYVLHKSRADAVIEWLKLRCWPDPEFPTGIVSSIYFDTAGLDFLYEKVNSDFLKTKVRIRWYADYKTGDPIDDAYIEVKNKNGNKREKKRYRAELSGKGLSEMALDNPKLFLIREQLADHGIVFSKALFPIIRIQFKRLRFIEPVTKARLCLDNEICVPDANQHWIPRFAPFNLNMAVFEMKGDLERLPPGLFQLTGMGSRKRSFSKYLTCYQKMTQTRL